MYRIIYTKNFSKSLKKINSSVGGKKIIKELELFLNILVLGKKIPENYKDHQLQGDLSEYRECHIRGDVLVVYKKEEGLLILTLIDIGSHSYLF
jgi:mRNA interferase YafQ